MAQTREQAIQTRDPALQNKNPGLPTRDPTVLKNGFLPVPEDISLLTGLSAKYEKAYKDELERLPSKNRKDYLEAYGRRWDNIKGVFDKKEIYTSPFAQQYLDAVVAEIERTNPQLKNERPFKCYFSRSAIPNASYIGEGIILFNMGLFRRLETESQVAFVLCHEISHCILRHNDKGIEKFVTAINSEEVQHELRKIKGAEFKKQERLEKLVKGLTFDSRRHSRDHESEADSMGVELMRPSRFDLSGALTALALLDLIDKDTDSLNMTTCLQTYFNAKDYPFQKKWIAREEGLLGGHAQLKEEKTDDSLKTHPDCPVRIKVLTPLVNRYKSSGTAKFAVDSLKFKTLKNTFRLEIIEYAFESEHYTQSLYYTLQLMQKKGRDPDGSLEGRGDYAADPYLVSQVGRVFNGLYAAQKMHTLGKVADLPSPGQNANYNILVQFIQNLYLEDFASINYYFLKPYHPAMDGYAPFKTAFSQSAKFVQP